MRNNHYLVSCYGNIFSLSKRGMREFLKKGADNDAQVSAENFGKFVGMVSANFTDWTAEDFRDAFKNFQETQVKSKGVQA